MKLLTEPRTGSVGPVTYFMSSFGPAARQRTVPKDRPSHAKALARARLEDHLRDNGSITVAAFRDLIGATRKFALPLLELFDRDKVTQRRGDLRVKHPDAGGAS